MAYDSVFSLILVAVAALAVFWLLVLPYRLSKGVVHRLGYHAYCGTGCEVGLQKERVDALLREQFKTGMREGMRGAASFGPDKSRDMVAEHSPLPEWKAEKDDSGFVTRVKAQYARLRYLFDVTDDPEVATMSLAVALGLSMKQPGHEADIFDRAMRVAASYGDISLDSAPETSDAAAASDRQAT